MESTVQYQLRAILNDSTALMTLEVSISSAIVDEGDFKHLGLEIYEKVYHSHHIHSLKLTFSHLKFGHPERKLLFQPSIFRCYVSFREGMSSNRTWKWKLQILCFCGGNWLLGSEEMFKKDEKNKSRYLENIGQYHFFRQV